jgi:hypothetical protein
LGGFFRGDPDVLIKILFILMPADLHNEFDRGACQKFVGTERTPGRVGGDPFVLGIFNLDISVAFLMDKTNGLVNAGQLPVVVWYCVIGDQILADAIMDRFVNDAHHIELHSESLRRKRRVE